jgi:hypothetical protein
MVPRVLNGKKSLKECYFVISTKTHMMKALCIDHREATVLFGLGASARTQTAEHICGPTATDRPNLEFESMDRR